MFELGSTKDKIHDSDESYFFEILKNTNDKNENIIRRWRRFAQ